MITRALFLLVVVLGAFDLPIPMYVKSAGTNNNNNNNNNQRSNNNITMMSTSSCNACRMHEEIRALSLQAIKEQILNKLGLKQAPNMTGRPFPRIPPISKLMDMYGVQADQPQSHEPGITHHDETDEFAAKTESVFVLAQPHKKVRHPKSNLDILYFKFTDRIIQHRVLHAELSVWIMGTESADVNESLTVKFNKSDKIHSNSFDPRQTKKTNDIKDNIRKHNNRNDDDNDNNNNNNNDNNEKTDDIYHDEKRHDEAEENERIVGEQVYRVDVSRSEVHSASDGSEIEIDENKDNVDADEDGNKDKDEDDIDDEDDEDDEDDDDEDEDEDDEEMSESAMNSRRIKRNDKQPSVVITLQRILRNNGNDGSILLGSKLKTRHLRPVGKQGKWVQIELRRMVAEWFKHPRDNLGVALKIKSKHSPFKKSSPGVEIRPGTEHAPYLQVRTQELDNKRSARTKRNVGLNCDESSQETRCCRYKLTVDFEKFGWDWIIAPKKYDANYCSGECPLAFLPAYPNTHLVSLAEPPNNTGPCCAPRKLSEITMLYFDNEYQIVFSRLPGMVVERCGCS